MLMSLKDFDDLHICQVLNIFREKECGCRDLNPSVQLGKLMSYRTRLQPQLLLLTDNSLMHRDSSFDIETLLSNLRGYFRILSPSTANPQLESSRIRASFQLSRSSNAATFIPSKSGNFKVCTFSEEDKHITPPKFS